MQVEVEMSDSTSKQVSDSKPFTVSDSRYSKGNYIVRCPSTNGLKSRAARLIGDGLNCRYTGLEKGYVASPSKPAKFQKLYAAGWDANFVTGELQPDLSAATPELIDAWRHDPEAVYKAALK